MSSRTPLRPEFARFPIAVQHELILRANPTKEELIAIISNSQSYDDLHTSVQILVDRADLETFCAVWPILVDLSEMPNSCFTHEDAAFLVCRDDCVELFAYILQQTHPRNIMRLIHQIDPILTPRIIREHGVFLISKLNKREFVNSIPRLVACTLDPIAFIYDTRQLFVNDTIICTLLDLKRFLVVDQFESINAWIYLEFIRKCDIRVLEYLHSRWVTCPSPIAIGETTLESREVLEWLRARNITMHYGGCICTDAQMDIIDEFDIRATRDVHFIHPRMYERCGITEESFTPCTIASIIKTRDFHEEFFKIVRARGIELDIDALYELSGNKSEFIRRVSKYYTLSALDTKLAARIRVRDYSAAAELILAYKM
jgi:hypothetical protein